MTELEVNHPTVNQSVAPSLIISLPQEAGQEVQCEPVTRQLCSALPSLVTSQAEQVCEVSLERVCTTILATKYVKVNKRRLAVRDLVHKLQILERVNEFVPTSIVRMSGNFAEMIPIWKRIVPKQVSQTVS